MRKLLFLCTLLLPACLWANEVEIGSPDGRLIVTVNDNGGQASYRVSLNGQPMLLPSALGLKANFADFTQGLTITGHEVTTIDHTYELPQGKRQLIHFAANQCDIHFANAKEQTMTIRFVVADHDVAFRYLLSRQKGGNPKAAVIESETTAFRFDAATTTFLSPQSDAMIGWERTKPSYEEEYKADAPMSDRSQYGHGYTFPCLFHTPTGWALVSETGVTSQYCGSRLSDYDAQKGYTVAYPMAEEYNGWGSTTAAIALPGATPWRTITVGATPAPIVETTIATDVVEPMYTPSHPFEAGRYTWSWLMWQDESINYDDQVKFIDTAAALGYEYCLVDNWWDTNIGRDRIAELSRYARQKEVSLMLWYNSNGNANDAPQGPRNCMDTPAARDREMAWMQSIGVKGIKVDFFSGDKQETMRLYEDILYDANRYGLQVVFHGCTLPRGWERIYPNFVSSEAVLASENVRFNKHFADTEPFQLTLHPFCRNAVAAIDWGGVMLNRHMSKSNRSNHERITTNLFEIASGITNQAAVQCVAVCPNNLDEISADERQLLKELPATWSDTRFIDGYPGKYIVLARRHGDQWYVAGLNGTNQPLTLNLALPIAQPEKARAYTDSKAGTTTLVTLKKADKKGLTKVTLQPRGGLVIIGE